VNKPVTLPVPPSGNRYWRHARGRTYRSEEANTYRDAIAFLWPVGSHPPIRRPTPVRVSLDWYRERASGDLDNRAKCMLDSLNGVAYEDDSQVIDLRMRRFDDKDNPRIEVTVEAVG
jgi:crossover junction endodeoxyribonuclease RusA